MKRPSRGRGEYELAETHGATSPGDLVAHEFQIDFGPFGVKSTGITLANQGDKLRLRIASEGGIHLARQVEAALLLPKSIREESQLPAGQPVLMEGRYLMRRMVIDQLALTPTQATVRFGILELSNQSQIAEEVDVGSRVNRIRAVVDAASAYASPINTLLETYRAMMASAEPVSAEGERLVRELMGAVEELAPDYDVEYVKGTDCVEALERMHSPSPPALAPTPIDEIPPEEIEIRRREAVRWRQWANARGPETIRFRRAVRDAYDSRCIVCGLRLPKSDHCNRPGVDSAHILPWSAYDLETVQNGLSMCKLHHWAFDEGLLTVVHAANGYRVKLTRAAIDGLSQDPESLAELRRVCGPIPHSRLPADQSQWPRAAFIERRASDLGIEPVD